MCLLSNTQSKKKESDITLDVEMADYYRIKNEGKAKITYEHDRRVETYPFARNAIREAIYNAIAHNCYMYGTPIQIWIEEEQIIISNRCILPEGWTAETLMQPHDSIPYNPDIANVFYRAGFQPEIRKLEAYYTSQQWKDDYAMDEVGTFPDKLKRGVLSQDGIWNLLERNKELTRRLGISEVQEQDELE